MEKYDYLEAVTNDVKEYINSEIEMSDYSDRDELEEYLNEHLFYEDSVTGNASGSYTGFADAVPGCAGVGLDTSMTLRISAKADS